MARTELAVDNIEASPRPSPLVTTRPRRQRRRLAILPVIAAAYLAVLTFLCAAAPLLPLPDPTVSQGAIASGPFGKRILGTDQLGRDLLSRLLWGGRVSIFIAVVATTIALLVGLTLGLLAGYFRGVVDTIISGIVDVALAFPTLVLLMVIIAVRGASTTNLIIGLVVVLTTGFTRLARASAISFSQREFVRTARGLGGTNLRVLTRELLPNVLPSLNAYALSAAAHVFLIEGSLSFLGLGVPAPTSSWGSMIQGGRPMFRDSPNIVLVPAITMSLTVIAFNLLGDHFRHGRVTIDTVPL